jgi:tripartite-type tricarboxylate transporter receptor subunit TctC
MTGMTRAQFLAALKLGAAAALVAKGADAQPAAFPTRSLRIVVPFPPGGGADILARLIAAQMQPLLGQGVVVENRAGAAGRIGTGFVAKAEPDGYTLLMSTEASMVISPHTGEPLGYDPLKDFAPISLVTRNVAVLAVHPSFPANTLAEFFDVVRANPNRFFYASSGVGGPNHLAAEILKRMSGLQIEHVPFQGTGAAIPAVLGNQVNMMFGFMQGLIPHQRRGAVRVLGVTSAERSAALPDVPAIAELVPGYDLVSWIGLLAPAGTPQPVLGRISDALVRVMQDTRVQEPLLRDGSDIVASTPAEFGRAIAADYVKYGQYRDILQRGS